MTEIKEAWKAFMVLCDLIIHVWALVWWWEHGLASIRRITSAPETKAESQ